MEFGELSDWLSQTLGQLTDEDTFNRYILPTIIVTGLLLLMHPLKEINEPNIRRSKKRR